MANSLIRCFLLSLIFSPLLATEAYLRDLEADEAPRISLRPNIAPGRCVSRVSPETATILGHISTQVENVFNSKPFADALRAIDTEAGFEFTKPGLTHRGIKYARAEGSNPLRVFEQVPPARGTAEGAGPIIGATVLDEIRGGMSLDGTPPAVDATGAREFSFELEMYWNPFTSARASTTGETRTIRINIARFQVRNQQEFNQWCNTIAHELTHCYRPGYAPREHEFWRWSPNSIPYAVGNIVEELLG